MRSDDQDRLQFRWNCADVEEIQLLELDIFALNERLQHGDIAVSRERWLFVAEHIAESIFLALDYIHHRARNCLLAFESADTRAFSESHSALVDLRHLGRLHGFVASFVINHQETFVTYHLVFVEHLFRAGKIAFRIDAFDVDLSFARILVFRQQILHVSGNWRARGKENNDPHLAFDGAEETLCLIR